MPASAAVPVPVLVVEDDAAVCMIVGDILVELGYSPDVVTTPEEALERLRSENTYRLLFSDVLLPSRIDGICLAEIVREEFPGMPIVLTTGYADAARLARRKGLPILTKPYSMRDLERALKSALDQSP